MQTHIYYWGLFEEIHERAHLVARAYDTFVRHTDDLWEKIVLTSGSGVEVVKPFTAGPHGSRRQMKFRVTLPAGEVYNYVIDDVRVRFWEAAVTARSIQLIE